MSIEPTLLQISDDDFARRYSLRGPSLMWFLGAGASASAGIPTAGDMIWEFKQQLFISQRRISPQAVADLSNPAVRARLQSHVDASGSLPPAGAPDEYAALFEAVYPAEQDRRSYLDAKVSGAKPSHGHLALATLMRAQRARLVWTTNVDSMVADGCAKVYDATGKLTTVTLDAPDLAAQLIGEERWPIEVKLHGDFRSRRLKNTSDELLEQDVRLRQLLIDSCRRFGLVVVGYSGRDASIMDALEKALDRAGAFPAGLFWLHRRQDPLLPRVGRLLTRAAGANVEAALVPVENFDEALRDLIRVSGDLDTTALDAFGGERLRRTGAPRPSGRTEWPVVRLNALPVVCVPNVCRRVVCQIGGYAEIREAVRVAGADLLVARRRAGVLVYGSDADAHAVFDPYGVTEFDLHTIETRRLRYDSAERGLLRNALSRALARERGLDLSRRGRVDLLAPSDPSAPVWAPLQGLVGSLSGTVAGHPELHWREGIGIRLGWADDRLWLLVEPRSVFDGLLAGNKAAASDFGRERTVKRYNQALNDLIAFWAALLPGDGGDLRALGVGDGVDAVFRLGSVTAFSRRAHP